MKLNQITTHRAHAGGRMFVTFGSRRCSRCCGVGSIATTVLMAYALLASHPVDAAAKSCLRDGAKLVVGDRSVRVVSIRERPSNGATRVERMVGCWVPTGRRFTLFRERDFGDDERQSTEWEIVDGRFVGAKRMFTTGVGSGASAENFDVRAHKRLVASSRCNGFRSGNVKGIQDVVFLTGGGMAYACDQLWLQSTTKGTIQLEPAGTAVGVSKNSFEFPMLYWTVVGGGASTVKTMSFLE